MLFGAYIFYCFHALYWVLILFKCNNPLCPHMSLKIHLILILSFIIICIIAIILNTRSVLLQGAQQHLAALRSAAVSLVCSMNWRPLRHCQLPVCLWTSHLTHQAALHLKQVTRSALKQLQLMIQLNNYSVSSFFHNFGPST